jgi:hypothetical protein
MQVKPVFHRVRGFCRLADYALRWGMIAPDAQRPGYYVTLDSIELRAQNERRCIITCTDLHFHFASARAIRSHAGAAAAQFFRLIQAVIPFAIEGVLTNHVFTHWHTYPKTPKMNAHCERFNRNVQEACIDYHYDRPFRDDLTDFNLEFLRYLDRYIDKLCRQD